MLIIYRAHAAGSYLLLWMVSKYTRSFILQCPQGHRVRKLIVQQIRYTKQDTFERFFLVLIKMLHLKLLTCFICLGLISAILSFQKFPLKLNEFEPENELKQDTLVSWTWDLALIKSCIVQHANVWDIKATTILLVGSSSTFKYSASGRAETWIENLVSEK